MTRSAEKAAASAEVMCWEFVETGVCNHSDAEHDAMADVCVISPGGGRTD